MEKLTKVVKTDVYMDEVSFKDGKKKYTFIKVMYSNQKSSNYSIFEKSLLPKGFNQFDENKKVDTLLGIRGDESYRVATEKYLHKLPTYYTASDELFKSFNDEKNFVSAKKLNGDMLKDAFKEGRIICTDNYGWDHLIHVFGDFAPIVGKMTLSYIGTPLANDCIPWDRKDEIINHLKNLSYVEEVNEDTIPYYNADENRTNFLEITVSFSKEERDSFWASISKKEKSRVDVFSKAIRMDGLSYNKDVVDLYELRQFFKA